MKKGGFYDFLDLKCTNGLWIKKQYIKTDYNRLLVIIIIIKA